MAAGGQKWSVQIVTPNWRLQYVNGAAAQPTLRPYNQGARSPALRARLTLQAAKHTVTRTTGCARSARAPPPALVAAAAKDSEKYCTLVLSAGDARSAWGQPCDARTPGNRSSGGSNTNGRLQEVNNVQRGAHTRWTGNPELRARVDPQVAERVRNHLQRAGLTLAELLGQVAAVPEAVFDHLPAGGLSAVLQEAIKRQTGSEGAAGEAQQILTAAREEAGRIIAEAKAGGGVPIVERRLLAALGHWRVPVQKQAKQFLSKHGLPDTAENRVAALVEALDQQLNTTLLPLRQLDQELADRRQELRTLDDELTKQKEEYRRLRDANTDLTTKLYLAQADLDAALLKARKDFEQAYGAAYERQQQLAEARVNAVKEQAARWERYVKLLEAEARNLIPHVGPTAAMQAILLAAAGVDVPPSSLRILDAQMKAWDLNGIKP